MEPAFAGKYVASLFLFLHPALAAPAHGFAFGTLHVTGVSFLTALLQRVRPASSTPQPAVPAHDAECSLEH